MKVHSISPLLHGYDSRIEDISYVVAVFYTTDTPNTHQLSPNWSAFLGMSNMWFMISTSLFCVIYFGIKCYWKLTKSLVKSKMSSYYKKSIQQQLFQALVMQTLIPVVLMYAPIVILFIFPMFNIEVGFISSFITATIAIYPAVDPLPTMFIIENYRKTLCCCLWMRKKKKVAKAAVVNRSVDIQN
ncbi:hypothetical protein GCK72_004024 [Caenorhabditis remanei]|uniref:Uncharacterized protein n=1 Tax=Caenorhabditis remanei TaxID=31234 RepID=A0A6A5H8N1_CAERE|nr:hypothetical protein GCK72_004024 [Caenorhabditis remanei]KAF1764078.1 hypothetical protein GCK72_004024 [Caenorhabditis remanei]